MITYRLADSLPHNKLKELDRFSAEEDLDRRKTIEKYLDSGLGSCLLKTDNTANIVINNWLHWSTQKYDLINFVVMPNHVHILIRQIAGYKLESILHSWKSYTSKVINQINNKSGPVWSQEYWDRYIRDETHFRSASNYINNNPVKAKLVAQPVDWPFLGMHYL